MNLTRCEKGHFYDADAYKNGCPHCHKGDDNPTVAVDPTVYGELDATVPLEELIPSVVPSVSDNSHTMPLNDDMKTVRYYDDNAAVAIEPVVGWLVCVEGACVGQDYKLKTGKNFIGRASDMDVVLDMDNKVSRNRHAILIYEPRSRQFIAQPGDSRELFYLNDQVVLVNEIMKAKDVITVGKTKLMLIPCCDANFCWDDVIKEEE